jgi:non-canonical (house-cleaning) NTP pyrophosphatase
METLKGTPFYVDIAEQPVSSDEYLKIIQQRVKDAQMKRRQEEKHVGMESANFYMEELNRQKRERLRVQAEQQSQQWQQGGQQRQP